MAEGRSHFRRRWLLALGAIVTTMIVAVIVMTFGLAQRQTQDAIAAQRSLARGMVNVRLNDLSDVAEDYSYWDDAFNNLSRRFDPIWAQANIGQLLNQTHDIDYAFVIDPDGRFIYSVSVAEGSEGPVDVTFVGGFDAMMQARRRSGPNATQTGLLLVDGQPALVAMSPLRPFSGQEEADPGRRHLLVFADLLDKPLLAKLSNIYQLPNLGIVPAEDANPASIAVRTFDGEERLHLAWDGATPGAQMLRDLLPLILLAMAVFGGLTALTLRSASRSAKALEISERRASHDLMTGLWNRSALLDHLENRDGWVRLGQGFALLYIDLDGFKAVNDTHGHDIGDAVLRVAAGRLENTIPKAARAYRLGGDEFAVVLPDMTHPVDIRAVGESIIACLSSTIAVAGLETRIGATVGVAIASGRNTDILELLRLADQALYAGKRTLKGTVRFHIDLAEEHGQVSA
ncbi:diguanylate cyclase domain-containing protein [Aureimonas frigidaquae]|uniref:diguanylate cyclase domain-containing protein n=1 Tax=Aureimonas frigidaquae TaxID=424757 RepID=UPI000782B908|nr:diguanylate cyclase [Aureimonas frigidaquae]